MAQKARDSRLENRSNRLGKAKLGERLYKVLGKGLALCYRRTSGSYGTWSVRFIQADGRYCLEALGAADDHEGANGQTVLSFEQAQVKAFARHRELQKAGGIVKGPLTVKAAADHYMEWFRLNRKSEKTTQANIDAHILPKWGETQVAELTTKGMKAWLAALATKAARKRTKKGAKVAFRELPTDDDGKRSRKSTANRVLTIFKAILNKAYEDEMVPTNEAWKKVKPFENVDQPLIRFLSPDESTRLLNACPKDLRLLVRAALYTGARISELARAEVSDYSSETKSLYIRPSKSSKARHIPLTEDGAKLFDHCCTGKSSKASIFVRADSSKWGKNYHIRPMLEACSNASIAPPIGFHQLRHTYASQLAQKGADLLTISKLLGHADTRITSRHYAHLTDKTLANAVNAFLPSFGSEDAGNIKPIRKRALKAR